MFEVTVQIIYTVLIRSVYKDSGNVFKSLMFATRIFFFVIKMAHRAGIFCAFVAIKHSFSVGNIVHTLITYNIKASESGIVH